MVKGRQLVCVSMATSFLCCCFHRLPITSFLNKTFFVSVSSLFCSSVCFVVAIYYSSVMEVNQAWASRVTRAFKPFPNLFIVVVHHTPHTPALLAMSSCYCWLYPCRVSYSLLQGHHNSCRRSANVTVEDQVQPSLNFVTVSHSQEGEPISQAAEQSVFFL